LEAGQRRPKGDLVVLGRYGLYECSQCGTALDIARDAHVRVMLIAASGKPNVRVLLGKNREELHRCEQTATSPALY
jgi:hypothetical protein